MLKVVVDTNQFVSGIISPHGPSAQLLEHWRKQDFILITAAAIIEEIAQTLHYPRIMRKYHLEVRDIEVFLHLLEYEAVVVKYLPKIKVVKDDPDDDKILACAVVSEADYIVSGDHHLLDLGVYKTIPILTVKEFLKLL